MILHITAHASSAGDWGGRRQSGAEEKRKQRWRDAKREGIGGEESYNNVFAGALGVGMLPAEFSVFLFGGAV